VAATSVFAGQVDIIRHSTYLSIDKRLSLSPKLYYRIDGRAVENDRSINRAIVFPDSFVFIMQASQAHDVSWPRRTRRVAGRGLGGRTRPLIKAKSSHGEAAVGLLPAMIIAAHPGSFWHDRPDN
jgi:hypothetical protein